jgi:hypothetical protein
LVCPKVCPSPGPPRRNCAGSQAQFFRSLRHPMQKAAGRDSASGGRSRRVRHARFRYQFSIPSGAAGTNLRKTARYAGENCDPLQKRNPVCRWIVSVRYRGFGASGLLNAGLQAGSDPRNGGLLRMADDIASGQETNTTTGLCRLGLADIRIAA